MGGGRGVGEAANRGTWGRLPTEGREGGCQLKVEEEGPKDKLQEGKEYCLRRK